MTVNLRSGSFMAHACSKPNEASLQGSPATCFVGSRRLLEETQRSRPMPRLGNALLDNRPSHGEAAPHRAIPGWHAELKVSAQPLAAIRFATHVGPGHPPPLIPCLSSHAHHLISGVAWSSVASPIFLAVGHRIWPIAGRVTPPRWPHRGPRRWRRRPPARRRR